MLKLSSIGHLHLASCSLAKQLDSQELRYWLGQPQGDREFCIRLHAFTIQSCERYGKQTNEFLSQSISLGNMPKQDVTNIIERLTSSHT